MAASIPDVILSPNAWTDLNTASGIAVGAAMVFQNKTNGQVNLWLGASAPSNLQDGFIVVGIEPINISASEPKVWVLGNGRVNVQAG